MNILRKKESSTKNGNSSSDWEGNRWFTLDAKTWSIYQPSKFLSSLLLPGRKMQQLLLYLKLDKKFHEVLEIWNAPTAQKLPESNSKKKC